MARLPYVLGPELFNLERRVNVTAAKPVRDGIVARTK
jgi:hypothetical protein